jgi:signal transduction histidine kinase
MPTPKNILKVKAYWMLLGGLGYQVGNYFVYRDTQWYNYADNATMGLMSIFGLLLLSSKVFRNKVALKISSRIMSRFLILVVILQSIFMPGNPFAVLAYILTAFGVRVFTDKTSINHWIFTALLAPLFVGYNGIMQFYTFERFTNFEDWVLHSSMNGLFVLAAAVFLAHQVYIFSQNEKELFEEQKKLNNHQSTLFSLVAHNIRTPISTIIGQLDIAKLQNKDSVEVSAIEPPAQYLEKLLRRIAIYQVKEAETDLVPAKQIFKTLENQFNDAVECSFNEKGTSVPVPKNIEGAIQNFLTNAVRYGHNPKLEWHSTSKHSTIVIEDSGEGMDQNTFLLYGKPSMGTAGGLGVGIFLSIRTLKFSGFKVWAGTETGRGTKIIITNDPSTQIPALVSYELKQELA